MGLRSTLLQASGSPKSLHVGNGVKYTVRKEDDGVCILHKDKVVAHTSGSSVLFASNRLALKDFFRYNRNDELRDGAECLVHEVDGMYYIECDEWLPCSGVPYPERLVNTGGLSYMDLFGRNVYVLLEDNVLGTVQIIDSAGRRTIIDFGVIIWNGNIPVEGVWRCCCIQAVNGNYIVKVDSERNVPDGRSVIVNGHSLGF